MDIDKPLDEIIKAKPRQKRGGAGRTGGRGGASAAKSAAVGTGGTRERYSGNAPRSSGGRPAPAGAAKPAGVPRGAPANGAGAEATKIIISNLPMDVTEPAVRDLMQSTVGPVRTVQMSYTATGKSTGQATVVFKNKGDANKAHAAYHNRMVDNQRPMKVEIALDMSALQSLASRVAPPPARAAPAGGARGGNAKGRGGNAIGGAKPPRKTRKTAEELDAEMSAYKETA